MAATRYFEACVGLVISRYGLYSHWLSSKHQMDVVTVALKRYIKNGRETRVQYTCRVIDHCKPWPQVQIQHKCLHRRIIQYELVSIFHRSLRRPKRNFMVSMEKSSNQRKRKSVLFFVPTLIVDTHLESMLMVNPTAFTKSSQQPRLSLVLEVRHSFIDLFITAFLLVSR